LPILKIICEHLNDIEIHYQDSSISYFQVKSTQSNKLSNKEVKDSIVLFISNSLSKKFENIKKYVHLSNANIGDFTKDILIEYLIIITRISKIRFEN
jgi:hypothetical protein